MNAPRAPRRGRARCLALGLLVIAGAGCAAAVNRSNDGWVADLETLTGAHFSAFERGDFESWGATMTEDAFMIAADPEGAFTGRRAIVAEMRRDYDEKFSKGLDLSIRSLGRSIGVSEGRVAWVLDPIDYTTRFQGRTSQSRLRFTGLATCSADGIWRFTQVHYSRPMEEHEAALLAARSGFVQPRSVGAKVEDGLEPLVERVRQAIADPAHWRGEIGDRFDAQFCGPALGDTASGDDEVRARLSALTGFRSRAGDLCAQRVAGGAGAWIVANVDRVMSTAAGAPTAPHRLTLGYVTDRGAWRLVQAHVSMGEPNIVE